MCINEYIETTPAELVYRTSLRLPADFFNPCVKINDLRLYVEKLRQYYLRLQLLVPLILVFKTIYVINKMRTPVNINQTLTSTKVVLLNTRKTTSLKFSKRNYYCDEKYLH